jgi:hypothetical protein
VLKKWYIRKLLGFNGFNEHVIWPADHPVSVSRSTSSVESIFSDPLALTNICVHSESYNMGTLPTRVPPSAATALRRHISHPWRTILRWPAETDRQASARFLTSVRYTFCLVLRSSVSASTLLLVTRFASVSRTLPENSLKLGQGCFLPHNLK